MRSVFLVICFLLGFGTYVSAEIYHGIGPLDLLGDLKTKFPNAKFMKLNPAWAQQTDVMYQIDGAGLSGKIIVKLYDGRPQYREQLKGQEHLELYEKLANEPDDKAISVEWVRWVPDAPIPLARFISKYGKSYKSGFDDDDLQPYRVWEEKGLIVYLSDDEKNVVRVDYQFTRAEHRAAWQKKYDFIPDWLKEANPAKKKSK